jgi:hypothetical protein
MNDAAVPATDGGGVDAPATPDAGGGGDAGSAVGLGSCMPLPTESCSSDGWCSSTLLVGSIFAVHAVAENDVWLGTATGAAHFDGTQVCTLAPWPGSRVRGIHGTGANDIWLVGDESLIAHWDGHTLRLDMPPVASGGTHWAGVWAASASDAWAVGEGSIARWDGSGWMVSGLPSGASGSLTGVGGLDSTHVFAVTGDATGTSPLDGDILAWNGSWSVAYTGDGTVTFRAVLPTTTTEAFAIGNSGVSSGVGRVFTGPASWTEDAAGSWTGVLNDAVADPSGTVRVVGDGAVIFVRGASGWTQEATGLEAGGSGPALYAASRGGPTVYVGGHGGAFLRRTF